jgi:hypothetical protein
MATNPAKSQQPINATAYIWPLIAGGLGAFNLWAHKRTTFSFIWNILLVSGSAFAIILFAFAQWGQRRIAKRLVRTEKDLFSGPFEYRDATEADYAGLDRAFYGSTTAEFTAHGFHFVHDDVNLTINKMLKGKSTVLRRFLGDRGTTMVDISHLPVRQNFKTIACETELSDGTYVTTSNATAAAKTRGYPFVDRLLLPRPTPAAQIIQRHRDHVKAILAGKPGVTLQAFSTLEDIRAAQQRMQAMRVAYRRSPNFDYRAEVEAIRGRPLNDAQSAIVDVAANEIAAINRSTPPPLPRK